MAENEIKGTGNIGDNVVTAVLSLGGATLTLSYPQLDESEAQNAVDLVTYAEEAFGTVLAALVEAAEAQEASSGGE